MGLGKCSNDVGVVDVAWRFEHFNLDLLEVARVSRLLVRGWRRATVSLGEFTMVRLTIDVLLVLETSERHASLSSLVVSCILTVTYEVVRLRLIAASGSFVV